MILKIVGTYVLVRNEIRDKLKSAYVQYEKSNGNVIMWVVIQHPKRISIRVSLPVDPVRACWYTAQDSK